MHYHRIKLILSLLLFTPSLLSQTIETFIVPRPDGSEIIGYFHEPKDCVQFPVMIVCQGSYVSSKTVQSCRPLFDKIVKNFGMLPIGILAIEKRGSYQDRCDLVEFNEYNTVTNRINDNITVIQALQDIIDGWNGNLIMMGGSEGTFVASEVAEHLQHQVVALVLFAGGGYQPFKEEIIEGLLRQPWYIRWYIRWCLGSEQDIRNQFVVMTEDPSATKMWAGQTYRYWADAQARSLIGILDFEVPVYYMMGCNDECFESGKKLQKRACQENKSNITFAWYDGLGHDMGDSFDRVMQDAKDRLNLRESTE